MPVPFLRLTVLASRRPGLPKGDIWRRAAFVGDLERGGNLSLDQRCICSKLIAHAPGLALDSGAFCQVSRGVLEVHWANSMMHVSTRVGLSLCTLTSSFVNFPLPFDMIDFA